MCAWKRKDATEPARVEGGTGHQAEAGEGESGAHEMAARLGCGVQTVWRSWLIIPVSSRTFHFGVNLRAFGSCVTSFTLSRIGIAYLFIIFIYFLIQYVLGYFSCSLLSKSFVHCRNVLFSVLWYNSPFF